MALEQLWSGIVYINVNCPQLSSVDDNAAVSFHQAVDLHWSYAVAPSWRSRVAFNDLLTSSI